MRHALAVAAVLAAAACSGSDDESGDTPLVLVEAPATATPGSAATQPIVVKVVNGDGTAAAGVPVSWSVGTGGGSLAASVDTSGEDGLATAHWTPGLTTGTQQIRASIQGQPALVIPVTAAAFIADKIATQYRSGCGIRAGAAWCWNYSPEDEPATTATVTRTMTHVSARDLAMAGSYLCLLDQAGAAHCQRWFQTANPDEDVSVSGLPPLAAISGGGNLQFCGISQTDQTPWCWEAGSWNGGQVSTTLQLSHISSGGGGTCGFTAAGVAWCWGFSSSVPALVPGGHTFQDISVGTFATCAVQAPAALYCWDGYNTEPDLMSGINAAQVAMGNSLNLFNGLLGATGFNANPHDQPQYVLHATFPLPTAQISAGDDTPCVVAANAAVYCLGVNDNIEQSILTTWEAVPAQP